MSNHFQTFSPSYQNISNRLNRLRQHSRNHQSAVNLTGTSLPKNINLFVVDNSTSSKRRLSPTPLTFKQQNYGSDKFTGRVAKNVGLKKYNQRQLKQAMDCRLAVHLKTQQNVLEGVQNRICSKVASSRRQWNTSASKQYKWTAIDEVVNNEEVSTLPKKIQFQKTLIPGKMYQRSFLCNLLRQ